MSYKSLLFCRDERTARAISQILTELEFAVEPVNETFAAVKKLGGDRFDALVVDCQDEQEAAVLFKAARDSEHNHSSLSVAIVEGQAGVAKAFRIGANLVLSKPINIEQSKGTLRVARGLLRKNEVKPAGSPVQSAAKRPGENLPVFQRPATPISVTPAKASEFAPALAASTQPEAPFSALEVEADPTPQPEAAEAAVLESLPELSGKLLAHSASTPPHIEAEPIAGGAAGAAAAAAPALAKAAIVEHKADALPPMVTNQPIVSGIAIPERVEQISSDVPIFSALEKHSARENGAAKFFKFVAVLCVIAGAAYFGWTKLQPLKYLQRIRAARATAAVSTPAPTPIAVAPSSSPEAPAQISAPSVAAHNGPGAAANNPGDVEISATSAHSDTQDDEPGDIKVQELPMSRDSKPAAPKPEPLMVRPDSAAHKPIPALPAPPQVQVSNANASSLPLSNLPDSAPALPKLAPNSLRVSQGVSQGLILKKVPPVYPQMALQMRKGGEVELLVTITKQGTISNVRVVSGDGMLARAAVDAVRQWKYRPYLLNGEPVDIQTQITINFTAPH